MALFVMRGSYSPKYLLPQSDDGEEEDGTASDKVVLEWELRLVLMSTVPAMTQIRA